MKPCVRRRLLLTATASIAAILTVGTVQPAAAAEPVDAVNGSAANGDAHAEADKILVTFVDEAINRLSGGTPGHYYGGARDYQSSSWARRISAGIAHDHQLTIVREWPMQALGVHCVVYRIPSDRGVQEILTELAGDDRVASAQAMNRFRVLHEDPYRPLQRSLTRLDIREAHQWSTGAGTVVAVVDTGLDRHHPDLTGQIVGEFDFTDADPKQFDADIHGTAVAGVIAAAGNNDRGIIGVAPSARILSLKACWPEHAGAPAADCNTFTLAQALDTAIRKHVDVLNLSLSGPADPLLEALLEKAIQQNIAVIVAVPTGIGGTSQLAERVPRVIRVRNTSDAGDATSTLRAPGDDILTTFPGDRYDFISGSSFAAANVSGVVALLRSVQPKLSVAELPQLLSGAPSTEINACEAIVRVRGTGHCNATPDMLAAERYSHP